jgi:hypothetical protein
VRKICFVDVGLFFVAFLLSVGLCCGYGYRSRFRLFAMIELLGCLLYYVNDVSIFLGQPWRV